MRKNNSFKWTLILAFLISALSSSAQEYSIGLNIGGVYTMPKQQIRYFGDPNNRYEFPYKIPLTNKIGVSFERKIDKNYYVGLAFDFEGFDFGLDKSFSGVSQTKDTGGSTVAVHSFGALAMSTGTLNSIYKLSVLGKYEKKLTKKSSLILGLQASVFYYATNPVGNDTSWFNAFYYQPGFRSAPFLVLTQEVVQRPGVHFAIAPFAAYDCKLGKAQRWTLEFKIVYQQGFGYFLNYKQLLVNQDNLEKYSLVEHKINGTSFQFTTALKYNFGSKFKKKTKL